MSPTFEAPPRLAVGHHPNSKLYMCGMNVISWENGDSQITDVPECSPKPLARMVQAINDGYCTHLTREYDEHDDYDSDADDDDDDDDDYVSVLCAPCSIDVLRLAHRTVGRPRLTMSEGWRWVAAMAKDTTAEYLKTHGDDDSYRLAAWSVEAALTMADGEVPEPAPVNLVPGKHYPTLARHIHYFVRQLRASDVPLEYFAISASNLFYEAGMHFATRGSGLAKMTEAHRVIDMWNSVAATRPKVAADVREPVTA